MSSRVAAASALSDEFALGLDLLRQVTETLEAEGVRCWLDAGACLRAVRNGAPWSTDVDLGMWRDDYDAVLRAVTRLRAAGFQVRYQGGMPYFDDHVALHPPIGASPPFTNIDLVLYRRMGDEAAKVNSGMPDYSQPFARALRRLLMNLRRLRFEGKTIRGRAGDLIPFAARAALWRGAFAAYRALYRSVWFVVPRAYFEELRELRLHGVTFSVPKQAEAYLAYRYGEGWRAPQPGWRLSDGRSVRLRPIRRAPTRELLRRFVESDVIVWHRRVKARGSFEFSSEEIRAIRARDRG